jgi:hypothetical protein
MSPTVGATPLAISMFQLFVCVWADALAAQHITLTTPAAIARHGRESINTPRVGGALQVPQEMP